jgi:hypothetical protein
LDQFPEIIDFHLRWKSMMSGKRGEDHAHPHRLLTALVASCVSSVVTLAVAHLMLPPNMIRGAPDPQATQPVVRAERFQLVDADGIERAALGIDNQGVGLIIQTRENQPRIVLRLGQGDYALVGVTNAAGNTAGLYAMPDGQVAAGVQGRADRGDVLMEITADGTRAIKIFQTFMVDDYYIDDRLVWQAP